MKKIIAYFVFYLVALNLQAQQEAIQNIKEQYYAVKENIKTAESENIGHVHTVETSTMVPGVGLQNTVIKFFYDSREHPDCEAYYLDILRLVSIEYQIAASMNYYMEYLFSTNEVLMFQYTKAEGMEAYEERYYFDKDTLIKLKIAPLKTEATTGATQEVKDKSNNFSAEEEAAGSLLQKNAQRYKELFYRIVAADNLEKGTHHVSRTQKPCH